MFTEIRSEKGLDHVHKENFFIDYRYEPLLPHKTSNFGPNLAVGDVNGDDLEDFFVGGAAESPGALWLQEIDGKFIKSQEEVQLQRITLRSAQENCRIVKDQYEEGKASLVRLNQAQQDYVQTDGKLAQARIRLRQAWTDLRSAGGSSPLE